MASTDVSSEPTGGTPTALCVDMNLDVVTLPVLPAWGLKYMILVPVGLALAGGLFTLMLPEPSGSTLEEITEGRFARLRQGGPRSGGRRAVPSEG